MNSDINTFISLLQSWGKIHNLTSNLDKDFITNQINDSIYPISLIDEFNSFLDIGTGAGFPGLIISIYNKDKKAFLVEPRKKRASFLNFVKTKLNLTNTTIINDFVQNISLDVDLITSRAVTDTNNLLTLSNNINTKAYLLYKGSNVLNEIKDIKYQLFQNNNVNYIYIKKKDLNV